MVIAFCNLVRAMLASLALLPAPTVAQSGDLNSLSRVLSRFEHLSVFANLLKEYPDVLTHAYACASTTIVAPTNEAFEKNQDLDFNNHTQILDILQYHMLQGDVLLQDVEVGTPYFAPTLLDHTIHTNATSTQTVILSKRYDGSLVFVSGGNTVSRVLKGDIPYSGGWIHIVDTVLAPPYTLIDICRVKFPELEAFLGALYQVGLAQLLSNMTELTVFAPSNSAFKLTYGALSMLKDEELRNVLAYHVIPNQVIFSTDLADGSIWPSLANGSDASTKDHPAILSVTRAANNIYIDSSQIIDPNILITNGILHVVANVMDPAQPNATPDLNMETQNAVFDLSEPTTIGFKDPIPFTSNLPCTANCPGSATTGAKLYTTQRVKSKTSKAGVAGSRPTAVREAWKAMQRLRDL